MTLLYDTLNGMYHLQKIGYVHGKFGPEWVAKTLSGYAVMEDPLNNNELPQNLNEKKHVYLSPEARRAAVKHLPPSSTYNIPKADVFAIGLFVLEAALLRRLNDYLDPVSTSPKLLGEALEEFGHLYRDNKLLVSSVNNMLELDPEMRPDFKELLTKMPEYELVKEHFDIEGDSYALRQNVPK